jgi:hypothetical protein
MWENEMSKVMPLKQRGLTFLGFMAGAVVLIFAAITGLKLIPAYMENATIGNLFVAIASDPEMQKASPREIRMSFSKRADVESVAVIKAEDIDIASDGGRLVLSASYAVKVPLAGNVSLYLEFNPSSDK